MKLKRIVAAMAVALLSSGALAQNAVLQNEYIKAGVNETTGTLGSGGNTSPGLLYDNTGSGTWNTSYDYLTPGSPYEGWAVRVDDVTGNRLHLYGNNNAGFQMDGNAPVTGAWVGARTAGSAVWAGSTTEFDIKHTYSLPSMQKYLDITTRIDAKVAMPNLYFGRYIDPDAVAAPGDSSATDNVRGYGIIPKTNVVFSEATVSRYALGLYSAKPTGVNTSIQGWTSDPKNYYNNVGGYDVGNGDDTIGIAFLATNVAVGDILSYNYAYIFGPSAFGAASSAIAGGAGGGTPGTSSFGTLADVGSATDAATSPSTPTPPPAPTVVSTSTALITVSDVTVVETSLPVITASLAHHTATEATGKQTIARETTTNVTTPMRRDVTTLTRTTSTWSDSTVTTSDSATSTASTLSNSVATSIANDSFSGRIDQQQELNNMNTAINRGLDMDAFRADGARTENGRMYINASGSKTSAANGYSGKSQTYGIAGELEVDKDWRIGAQYNRVHTKLDGVDSNTAQDKNHFGLFSILDIEGAKLVNNLGYAQNDIKNNRTIRGIDFNNSYKTAGNDVWLNTRLYSPDLEGFRPFVGFTTGRSTVGGYMENGSIQSARIVGNQSSGYNYGEAGLRFEQKLSDFIASGEVSTTTDNFKTADLRLAYQVNKDGQIAISGTHQAFKDQKTNTVTLLGIVRF